MAQSMPAGARSLTGRRSTGKRWLPWLLLLVLVIAAVVAWMVISNNDDDDDARPEAPVEWSSPSYHADSIVV